MPEDRYQSTFSIKQDLSLCIDTLRDNARDIYSLDFEVALDDIPEQLNIPEKLMDREKQLSQMSQTASTVEKGGCETIICTGDTGVGKTALVREFHKDLLSRGAYLAKGRSNVISSEVPYSALSAALGDLSRQLLTQDNLPSIRQRLRQVLRGNIALLSEVAPELTRIIGDAPDIEDLPTTPLEARNRLLNSIENFIGALSHDDRIFVLSIDNIQWIDRASLELIQGLIDRRTPCFLLIAAFRSNEAERDMTSAISTTEINKSFHNARFIALDNLPIAAVASMVSDSLFRTIGEALPLAEIIHSKTSGNPLAVREFLTNINDKELVFFDREHREWNWNSDLVSTEPPTENVSTLLAQKFIHLEPSTARLLKIASCIGDEFNLDTIKNVSGLSFSETSALLLNAIREGYIFYSPISSKPDKKIYYQFSHEGIQQAAYSLLDSNERRQIHTQIGNTFLDGLQPDQKDNIFDIVNQLNNSFESPESDNIDKKKLAELNLSAGRKAKQAAAFQASFKYLRTAIALQGQNIWVQYNQSLEMHLEAAETAYLCGDNGQMDLLLNIALSHAKNPVDQSRFHEIKLRSLIGSNDFEKAIKLGHRVLALLGLPLRQSLTTTYRITLGIRLLHQTIRMSRQSGQQTMTDPTMLAAMRVLMLLSQAGYLTASELTTIYILKMTQLSLKHGMAPESSFAYPMFGALLITSLGTIESGYRFGMLAKENLNETNKDLHCRTLTLVTNFILVWKQPIKESLEPLANAYRIGIETGDIEFALIAAVTGSANAFMLGHDLNSLDTNLSRYNQKASDYNQTPMLSIGSIYQQAVRNLIQENTAPWLLEGEVFSESQLVPFLQKSGDETSIANLYIVKLFMSVLFNHAEHAIAYAEQARQRIYSVASSPLVPFFILYESLACIMIFKRSPPVRRIKLALRIKLNQRQLRKWAQHAPHNNLHAYHLIEAELAQVSDNASKAVDNYELAIHYATQNGFLKDLGLSCELAGRFYENTGRHELALFYFRKARSSYVRWGALVKVAAIDSEFIELGEDEYLSHRFSNNAIPSPQRFNGEHSRYDNFLDLGSVIKASHVLSGEVILSNLLERLMQVALENAGAHNASLILQQDEGLCVEIASRFTGSTTEHQLQNLPIDSATMLPISIIQYVARAQEDLVLDDAQNDDIFTQDEYIITNKPKSILCIPILSKSHLTGILYLENMQTTQAFTQDRVATLKLIASHSAIAIENARLYQQLNDSRNKYLSLYQNAVEGIIELNMSAELTTVNPAATQLMGYRPPGSGKPPQKLDFQKIFVEDLQMQEFVKTLSEQKRVVGFEAQVYKVDRTKLWVSLSAQLIEDENGNPEHIEASFTDITERKRRERAEQEKRLAEAAAETKTQFLANMSHEIRTPMNAIIGYTDLALNTPLDDAQSTYLKTIKSSSDHLLRVINDILDISKIESGKLDLQKTPFRLHDIFDDIESLFKLEAEAKNLQLSLPEKNNITMQSLVGDPARIGQVVINLVSNAIKFTNSGRVSVDVDQERLQDESICLNFTVSDTGIGYGFGYRYRYR